MMHNPPHPGLTLRDDVLPALNIGAGEAAEQLRVSRQALSNVLNGHAAISPEMALRLEAWLGIENGGRADLWLAQQDAFDLWQTRQAKQRTFKAIERIKSVANVEFALGYPKGEATPVLRARRAAPAPRELARSAVRRRKA